MNKAFFSKFHIITTTTFIYLFIIGCGQKGALFLADETPVKKDSSIIKTVNKKQSIVPVLKNIKQLNIAGSKIQFNTDTVANWDLVLTDAKAKTSAGKINYILLKSDILEKKPTHQMIMGNITTKLNDEKSHKITTGNYLRFRSIEPGYEKVPKLIIKIKDYFDNNKDYQRLIEGDFIVDDNTAVDIYIKVRRN